MHPLGIRLLTSRVGQNIDSPLTRREGEKRGGWEEDENTAALGPSARLRQRNSLRKLGTVLSALLQSRQRRNLCTVQLTCSKGYRDWE